MIDKRSRAKQEERERTERVDNFLFTAFLKKNVTIINMFRQVIIDYTKKQSPWTRFVGVKIQHGANFTKGGEIEYVYFQTDDITITWSQLNNEWKVVDIRVFPQRNKQEVRNQLVNTLPKGMLIR